MISHTRKQMQQRGFTLVELLLVIAILGILASAVVVSFAGKSKGAQISRAKVDIKNIETAMEIFELEIGRFPTSSEGLGALVSDPGVDNWGGPYLRAKSVPEDPWGNPYMYDPDGDRGVYYDLYSTGPDGTEGTDDDIGNWEEDDG